LWCLCETRGRLRRLAAPLAYVGQRRDSAIPYDDRDFNEKILEPLLLEQRAREILGVSEKAKPAEIKRAYWRLAKAYHPDLRPDDPSRNEKFMAVAEAYDILTKRSSPTRRYALRKKPIHLPRVLDEQGYWRWWFETYADFL
jgi:hypothetical protein